MSSKRSFETNRGRRRWLICVLLGFCLGGGAKPIEDLSHGNVRITLQASPPAVSLDRDFVVTLTVETPPGVKAELPDLRDRFDGFSLAEGFRRPSRVLPDRRVRQEHVWRLVPEPEREYRLAPFAVMVQKTENAKERTASFATRAVYFESAPLTWEADGPAEVAPRPVWIPPTRRSLALWSLMVVLGLSIASGAVLLLFRLRRLARLKRMSPLQRALYELESLLHRELIDRGLYKDFYVELTLVVRRYIERAHGIRAPEQTTEEFLEAAAHHPKFTPAMLALLRDFLQSADLVKFAGQSADRQRADDAVRTARRYVEQDAALQPNIVKAGP